METVAVCEIKIVSEETINILPHSSVLYKPHNYIKYHNYKHFEMPSEYNHFYNKELQLSA